MELPSLRARIIEVALRRQFLSLMMNQVSEARRVWDEENQDKLLALKAAQTDLAAEEQALREATIIAFKETGNKAPTPGVGIREITHLDYDPKTALAYALEHRVALELNKKVFEGIARAEKLEFVTVRAEAQATIAQDLDKVLGTEAAAKAMAALSDELETILKPYEARMPEEQP